MISYSRLSNQGINIGVLWCSCSQSTEGLCPSIATIWDHYASRSMSRILHCETPTLNLLDLDCSTYNRVYHDWIRVDTDILKDQDYVWTYANTSTILVLVKSDSSHAHGLLLHEDGLSSNSINILNLLR